MPKKNAKKEKVQPLFEIDKEVEWLEVDSSWLQAVAFSDDTKRVLYIRTRDTGFAYHLTKEKFATAKEIYEKDREFLGRFISNTIMKSAYQTPFIRLNVD